MKVACCFNLDVCLRSFAFAVSLLLGLLVIVVGYYFVFVWVWVLSWLFGLLFELRALLVLNCGGFCGLICCVCLVFAWMLFAVTCFGFVVMYWSKLLLVV